MAILRFPWILLGCTLGTSSALTAQFLSPSTSIVSAGSAPVSVVAGEFNSSSTIPGLAIVNNAPGNVTLVFVTPSGLFQLQPAIPIKNPGAISVANFNAANLNSGSTLDIAVTSLSENTVSVLLLDGNGNVQGTPNAYPVGTFPVAIAAAAFGADLYTDLAVVNRDSNDVTLLQGDGKGGFTPDAAGPFAVGNNPSALAVGDFNGDGFADLAVANETDNTVTVLLGGPLGAFKPAVASPFRVGFHPSAIVAGDFNGDGNLDLAIANAGSNNVMLLLGNGFGGFGQAPSSPFATGTNPVALAVGDFNGDSFLDLAVANMTSNNITVLLGDGKGNFHPGSGSPFASGGNGPIAIAVGDFNQDGAPDLAIANNGSSDVTIALNGSIPKLTMVSSASYRGPVALRSLVTIFGSDVPAQPILAPPKTTCLNGVSVTVTDSSGATSPYLTLLYAQSGQINALLPQTAATGAATFTLDVFSDPLCMMSPSAAIEEGSIMLASTAPSLFSANMSGAGVALAEFVQAEANGQTFMPVYQCLPPAPCTPLPLNVSSGTSALVLYGTGIRNRALLSDVTVMAGTQVLPAFYAGPVTGFPGEDQVNVLLPASLAGSGIVPVSVVIGSMTSNQVTVLIQ